jgi:hypothetical protein
VLSTALLYLCISVVDPDPELFGQVGSGRIIVANPNPNMIF